MKWSHTQRESKARFSACCANPTTSCHVGICPPSDADIGTTTPTFIRRSLAYRTMLDACLGQRCWNDAWAARFARLHWAARSRRACPAVRGSFVNSRADDTVTKRPVTEPHSASILSIRADGSEPSAMSPGTPLSSPEGGMAHESGAHVSRG